MSTPTPQADAAPKSNDQEDTTKVAAVPSEPPPQKSDEEVKPSKDETPAATEGDSPEKGSDHDISEVREDLERLKISADNPQPGAVALVVEQPTETKQLIDMNRTSIHFGRGILFPGSIQEMDLVVGLKDELTEELQNNPYMLRVVAKCLNTEFDGLDEYVFSVRSMERFEYFEEVRFKIRSRERAQVKVAVKIPPMKRSEIISGVIEIQLDRLAPYCIPIVAKCDLPQISCIKELYRPDQDIQMIRIPAKRHVPKMPPIPFKNLSVFNFLMDVDLISDQQSQRTKAYDITPHNFVSCPANGQFFVNLMLKENVNYRGPTPIRETLRRVLVLKVKGSSICFHYAIEAVVYDSSNPTTVS